MAALTADKVTKNKHLGRSISLRVAASTTIYKGAMVRLDATGFAIPADDAAGGSDVIGIADENVDNSSGSDGDLRVRVYKGVFGLVNNGNVVQATTGVTVYSVDDQTVGLAADTTNDHAVGKVDDFSDGSLVYVSIE